MKVIFFDGYCNICDSYVKWVYNNNTSKDLFFASQQGEYAMEILSKWNIPMNVSYIIFYDNKNFFKGADAILEILKYMPRYRWLRVFGKIVPKMLIDLSYFTIAKNRYKLFGRKDSCGVVGFDKNRFKN